MQGRRNIIGTFVTKVLDDVFVYKVGADNSIYRRVFGSQRALHLSDARGAGRNKESTNFVVWNARLPCRFLLGDPRRYLHGCHYLRSMAQKPGEFDLHKTEHCRTCRGKEGFFDIIVEELLMDNVSYDFGREGNLKYIIKPDAKIRVENILHLLLVLKLSEKGRIRQRDGVLVFGQSPRGISQAGYEVVRT